MCGIKLKCIECVKNLGVKIMSGLNFSQQCTGAVNKANRMLGCNYRNFKKKKKRCYTYIIQ